MSDVYVFIYWQASMEEQGGLGGCSPRKFFEIASGAIFGSTTRHSNFFHTALAVVFAKVQCLYFRRKLSVSSTE